MAKNSIEGIEVCLTGGIGSGKSTVANMLVEHGAKLVDADIVTRDLQMPGKPVFLEMVEYFGVEDLLGDDVLLEDGALNRKGIAGIVFNDATELENLNKIVHPVLEAEMSRMREEYFEAGERVVVDFPLLVESGYKKRTQDNVQNSSQDSSQDKAEEKSNRKSGRFEFSNFVGIIVVDCEKDVAVERLVSGRGFSEEDALARMGNQASREERRKVADFLIDNSNSMDELTRQVEECWEWIGRL